MFQRETAQETGEIGDKETIRKQWNGLEKAYLAWYDEAYPNGLNEEVDDDE